MSKRGRPTLQSTCALDHVAHKIVESLTLVEQLALRTSAGFTRDLVRDFNRELQRRGAVAADDIVALSPLYLTAFARGGKAAGQGTSGPAQASTNALDFSLLHAAGLRQVSIDALEAVQLRGGPGTNQCALSLLPLVAAGGDRCIHPRCVAAASASIPRLHASTIAYYEVTIAAPPRDGALARMEGAVGMHELREWYHPLDEASLSPRAAAQRLRHPACVAVGIATPPFPVTGRMPGWDGHSFGYHSDDGAVFHGSGAGRLFGPTFSVGDTIGCGLILHNATALGPRLRRADAAVVQRFVTACDDVAAGRVEDVAALAERLLVDAVVPCSRQQWLDMQDAVARAAAAVPSAGDAWGHVTQYVDMLCIRDEDDSVVAALCATDASAVGATLFYTRNGRCIGCASGAVPLHVPWYACVGIDAPYVCGVNFGDRVPFKYDVTQLQRALWQRTELAPQPPLPRWVRAMFPTVKHGDAPRGAVVADTSGVSVAPPPPLPRSRHTSFDATLAMSAAASPASTLDAAIEGGDSARSRTSRTHSFNASQVCTSRDERLGATLLSAHADAIMRCKDVFPFRATAAVLQASHPCIARDAAVWNDTNASTTAAVTLTCMLRQQLQRHLVQLESLRAARAADRAGTAAQPQWRLHATADAAVEALMMDHDAAATPPPPLAPQVHATPVATHEEPYDDDDDDDVQSIDSEERRQWRKY